MLGTIDLTDEEAVLLAQINFEDHSCDALRRSCAAAAELSASLLDRGAIPESRLRYFNDPNYHNGKHSRLEIFEGNGTSDNEILKHPNFLRHLRYFIHGAGLPLPVEQAMQHAVGDPRYFTSGDLEPVRILARKLVREHKLGSTSSDKFFQLMIDLGASVTNAHSIRTTVSSVR